MFGMLNQLCCVLGTEFSKSPAVLVVPWRSRSRESKCEMVGAGHDRVALSVCDVTLDAALPGTDGPVGLHKGVSTRDRTHKRVKLLFSSNQRRAMQSEQRHAIDL